MKIAAPDLSLATTETAPLYAYILILVQEVNRMAAKIENLNPCKNNGWPCRCNDCKESDR